MYLANTYGILWSFRTVEHRLLDHLLRHPNDSKRIIAEAFGIRV